MSIAWQFLIAGLGTYLIRISAIALVGGGLTVSPQLERTLRLIAPSIVASIVVNSLVLNRNQMTVRVSWLVGAAVAAVVMRRYRSAGWAMTLAMLVVYALQRLGY